jgi:SAM-dependent methyltransferase
MSEDTFGFATHLESSRMADKYNRWVAEQFEGHMGPRILEVGCGIGNLSERWVPGAEAFLGIDPEADCIQKCNSRFAGDLARAHFEHDYVGAPKWVERWSEHKPDTIVAVNVLEHIRDDLDALRGFRQILSGSARARLCLFVPAFEFAFSSFDRQYGHFRRYSKETLRDKLLDAGFVLEELRYFNIIGLVGWWYNFVLMRRREAASGAVGLFDSVVVPIARRLEGMVPPPLGNSVVAVCSLRAPDAS